MSPLPALATAASPPQDALAGPADGWAPCVPATLGALLAQAPWSLVEFWTPSCLFSRLLAPVRNGFSATHGARLQLLCCQDQIFGPGFTRFGVTAMPAVVLFARERRVWRWFGATDVHLMRFELEAALRDAGSPGEAGHGA